MIVDADTHISPTPQGGNSLTIEELLARMDRAGVDRALAWLQPPYLRTRYPPGMPTSTRRCAPIPTASSASVGSIPTSGRGGRKRRSSAASRSSDTPFELMHVELAKYRALLDGEVSADAQSMILAGNLLRLLRRDGG